MNPEEFCESLAKDLVPIKKLASPARQLLRLSGVAAAFLLIIALLLGFREDMGRVVDNLDYYIEGLILLCLCVSAGFAALLLARPGASATVSLMILIALTLVWPAHLLFSAPHAVDHLANPDYSCARLVVISCIVMGSLILSMLSRGYVTRPIITYGVAFFASTSIGGVLLQLVCPGVGLEHLLVWHMLPVYLVPMIAAAGYLSFKDRNSSTNS